jgi:hypothetical protein
VGECGTNWGRLRRERHRIRYLGQAGSARAIGEPEPPPPNCPALLVGTIRTETWTPQDGGQERSAQVVVAGEVGASLRYATAKPVKSARADDAPPSEEQPS